MRKYYNMVIENNISNIRQEEEMCYTTVKVKWLKKKESRERLKDYHKFKNKNEQNARDCFWG